MFGSGSESGIRSRIGSRIRPGIGHAGGTLLTLVLLATVSVSLWLAWEAHQAARDHRAAVQATLRDYTGMAARELARLSEESVDWLVDEVLEDDRRGRRDERPPPGSIGRALAAALDRHDCACPRLRSPVAEFSLEPAAARVTVHPDTLDAVVARRLLDIANGWAGAPDGPSRALVFTAPGELGGAPLAIGYRVRASRRESGAEVRGFIATPEALGEIVEHWYEYNPLLPPLAGRDAPNDSLFHVRVETARGVPVFSSPGEWVGGLASRGEGEARWGGLRVEVNIRPGTAARLVAGGLPPSRTPLFLGMLALVGVIGAAGLVQIRREQELARLREDFVSGVSHELRTPLAQIRMFAELQLADKLRTDEDRRRAVRVIDREARRLSHLVENVLHFTRLRRAPAARRGGEVVSLEQAVEEAVEGFRPLLDEKEMEVSTSVAPGLRARVSGGALRQILVNLLDNAVKYGPRGQTVTLRAERAGERARISVEDQGPGIPHEERRHIWAPYHRMQRDAHGLQPGSGLGLAVVAALLGEHGGEAWLEDAPGGGARFVVELPLEVHDAPGPVSAAALEARV